MTRLPDELLRNVLDELEPNPDDPIPVASRRFLSQESLDRPSPPPRSCVEDIASFRCACKQFAAVGAPLLFARVVIRLSKRDLERLEELAEWPVAAHVKRFSYLVPYFFQQRQETAVESRTPNPFPELDFASLQRKANERQHIIRKGEDARVLNKAFKAFRNLNHIRILPLADGEQTRLLRLIGQGSALSNLVDLDWTNACYHCSRTVGNALLDARLQAIRFSYPKIKPQDALYFASQKLQSISNLAATLTSLTLQFEEVHALEHEVYQLSPLFRTAFSRAENMEAIHVGFMSPRPLDLRLEDVFQNVTWPKLVALGVHGWNLSGEEILDLALRHRAKLKGLRLRNVYLREGSCTWKHVLSQLRQHMSNLTWISLTGIDYVRPAPSGAEESDDGAPDSESDSDVGDAGPAAAHNSPQLNGADPGPSVPHGVPGPSHLSDEDFYSDSDSEDESARQTREIEYLDLSGSGREPAPPSTVRCCCSELDMAFLSDDAPISERTAKQWERWVVNRCPLHGKR